MFLHFDTLEDLLAAKSSLEDLINSKDNPSIDRLIDDLLGQPTQSPNRN